MFIMRELEEERYRMFISVYILCVCAKINNPFLMYHTELVYYSKTCLKRPLKIDNTKVVMENGCLMKVESIAECYNGSILQYF